MKHAQITQIIQRRNDAAAAQQRYDDASAGVNENPLHNAKARLEAADALTEATFELVHWVDNLLEQTAWDHGGVGIEDLHWLLTDDNNKEARR